MTLKYAKSLTDNEQLKRRPFIQSFKPRLKGSFLVEIEEVSGENMTDGRPDIYI